MTVSEHLTKDLVSHMVWPDEASAILDIAKAETPTMDSRWEDSADAYPIQMLAVLRLTTRAAAVKYLRTIKPLHIAILMLDPNNPHETPR